MPNPGLPVKGYTDQSDDKVARVNVHKELEERLLRAVEAAEKAGADERMCYLAFNGIQEACMWLNRAVFQPGRIVLPEDNGEAK